METTALFASQEQGMRNPFNSFALRLIGKYISVETAVVEAEKSKHLGTAIRVRENVERGMGVFDAMKAVVTENKGSELTVLETASAYGAFIVGGLVELASRRLQHTILEMPARAMAANINAAMKSAYQDSPTGY